MKKKEDLREWVDQEMARVRIRYSDLPDVIGSFEELAEVCRNTQDLFSTSSGCISFIENALLTSLEMDVRECGFGEDGLGLSDIEHFDNIPPSDEIIRAIARVIIIYDEVW